jgi:hypothetical protein
MSWKIFKNNMSLYMKNQGGIKSSDDFAKKLTNEYDMCVRRGLQTANQVPIMTPNKQLMLTLVKIACKISLSKKSGLHTFIDDIGKGVLGYWTGATLSNTPPIIPAMGAFQNLYTITGFTTVPGTWAPVGPLTPTDDTNLFLDRLVASLQIHSTTIQGMYITISLYPGFPLTPPAPGVLMWTGWTIP